MKHFVGKPSNITSRIYDQLSNLRCKNLGEYRCYEDVFTTRVMHRSDCNSPLWKEKFINGLPRLFGEKVKKLGEPQRSNIENTSVQCKVLSIAENHLGPICKHLKALFFTTQSCNQMATFVYISFSCKQMASVGPLFCIFPHFHFQSKVNSKLNDSIGVLFDEQ